MKPSISRQALRQMLNIFRYISRENPQAAERVLDRIYEIIDFIARHPGAGHATIIPGLRAIPIGRHPYVVLFRWDAKRGCIRITSILHTAQRRPALRDEPQEFRLAAMS